MLQLQLQVEQVLDVMLATDAVREERFSLPDFDKVGLHYYDVPS